ncbi:MAG: Smr/MutS family protein [bacterium]
MKNPVKSKCIDEEQLPKYVVVTDVLDLHGFFPEQVAEMVEEFINNAITLKLHRLRIIHGKGKSKLKYFVRKELENNPQVAEFGDAPPEEGGWGATIIILNEDEN